MNYPHIEHYKEYLLLKGYTSKTIVTYILGVNYLLAWLETENIQLEEVRHADIMAYLDYRKRKGNKPRTLQLVVRTLDYFFNYLIEEHHYNENPCSNILIRGIVRKVLHEILTPLELETLYKNYEIEKTYDPTKKTPPQINQHLARKRNKVLLGLLIYQGIKPEEACKLELSDIYLREGKITIQGGLRSNTRTLKLESHQIIDLSDYINDTRKHILSITNKTSNKLIITVGKSHAYNNLLLKLAQTLKKNNPKLKTLKHIRTSVITNWLKTYNLRKTQYMAGHRYVSSTEAYQINNIDELQETLKKYHPLF